MDGNMTQDDTISSSMSESARAYTGEQLWFGDECEYETDFSEESEKKSMKKSIAVGDILPYGIRMYYGFNNIFRLRDVGLKSRILIVGIIGSFTPFCWNVHFFEVLTKLRYFEERGIEYICCISTNDAFTQGAWGTFLGCYEKIIMLGDSSKAFTKTIGMDIVVPWLDENIRSKRYIIYAEDMVVTKILVAPRDELPMKWNCEHLQFLSSESDTSDEDSDSVPNSWV